MHLHESFLLHSEKSIMHLDGNSGDSAKLVGHSSAQQSCVLFNTNAPAALVLLMFSPARKEECRSKLGSAMCSRGVMNDQLRGLFSQLEHCSNARLRFSVIHCTCKVKLLYNCTQYQQLVCIDEKLPASLHDSQLADVLCKSALSSINTGG